MLSRTTIRPIVRDGIISLVNEDKTFYIDATVFPGNRGSPVFLKPFPLNFGPGIQTSGDFPKLKFIGVVGQYVPYEDVAVSLQTGEARIKFQENTGLSRVWSVSFVNEIVASDIFNEQLQRLLPKKD